MSLTIKYVYKETIAFIIGSDLFYLRLGPGLPQMFDGNIKLMVVPNIDTWLQLKTQQRNSYRGLCDMAASFSFGLQHAYTGKDMEHICKLVVRSTRDSIFKTNIAREFSAAYWVELMDPGKILKFLNILRNNFNRFKAKYSDDELYNILCRLWQFSNLYAKSEAPVFETLIRTKMLRSPCLPRYPDTTEVDQEVEKLVIRMVIEKGLTKFKGISDELVANVMTIHNKS